MLQRAVLLRGNQDIVRLLAVLCTWAVHHSSPQLVTLHCTRAVAVTLSGVQQHFTS